MEPISRRTQLLTGRYPLHNGIRRVIFDARRHREFLDPAKETSFASLLSCIVDVL